MYGGFAAFGGSNAASYELQNTRTGKSSEIINLKN
jgi:hypothetical protein